MALWKPYPIVGGAYSDDTKPWTAQDTVNYIPVRAERAGGRSNELLRSAPGGSLFAVLGDGPIRGARDVEGKLLVVSGRSLYQVFSDSTWTEIGTIPGVGRVQMTHNQIAGGNQVVIGNGISGYVYNTYTETLTQITDEAFPGFGSVDFSRGYIIGVEPQGRYWYHSQLADALDYSSLDRSEGEVSPDLIVGLSVSGDEVVLFSQTTTQFYTNTGGATGTYQELPGTALDVGCASRHSIARLDNSPFWLGNDGIVYRLNSYSHVPISTGPMSQAFSRCDMSKAFATVFDSRGHKIYYLTFPDGQTWGYDVTTQEWARRESYGLDRWRYNTLTRWNGVWIGGDYNSGKLLQLRWGYMREGVNPVVRSRTMGVLHDNQNPLTVNGFELVMDTGNPALTFPVEPALPRPDLVISGDLPGGVVGDVVSFQYTTSGGVQPYGDYSISGGALPGGLSMDASGLVTGTLTTEGDFAWTVSRTDADGAVATLADTSAVVIERMFAARSTSTLLSGETALAWPDTITPGITAAFVEARGGRVFAIATGGATGRVSADGGATWANMTGLPGLAPKAIVYAGGTWILVVASATNVYVSTDGVAFSARAYGGTQQAQSAIASGATVIVASTNNAPARRSTDSGATWASVPTLAANIQIWAIATSGTAMVAVSGNGNGFRSTDGGATWTSFATGIVPVSVAYGNGRFVIISTTATTRYSADDGATWATGAAAGTSMGGVSPSNELIFAHGVFVAAADPGISTSPDALAWTLRAATSVVSLAVERAGQ